VGGIHVYYFANTSIMTPDDILYIFGSSCCIEVSEATTRYLPINSRIFNGISHIGPFHSPFRIREYSVYDGTVWGFIPKSCAR